MKKILKLVLPVFLFFILVSGVYAQENIIKENIKEKEINSILEKIKNPDELTSDIYLFFGDGCPHCADEEEFLERILPNYPGVKVHAYEIWHSKENKQLYEEMVKHFDIKNSGIPTIVIKDKYFVGYNSDEITGSSIESAIKGVDEDSNKIKIPFFGVKEATDFSLPILTVVIGILDGFNPCAMWILIFLISLLLGMEDRKKMWIFGGAFIFTSGAVYFLFLAAWLNLFLFIGFVSIVRYMIGLVALGSGVYHVKEYLTNKEGACKVVKGEDKKKLIDKFKKVVSQKNFLLALGGIIVLAVAVNLIELVCSAGLPAVYTQVLTMSDLSPWQHYGYLILYILFFMLDDLFVFFIAMTTLKMTFISSKYTRYSNIIGGVLMLIIGILLIFKPAWLFFG